MNNIEIKGNTTQKEDVDPEKPKEIKNEVILSVIDNDGKQKQIPIDIAFNGLKEGEYFFKENDKWYLHKLEDRTERIKMMNNIEILEKLKDEQYTKETVNTLYEFYDEEFKPYVLSTEERDALENLIQENKELKKENEKLTYARNWYFKHFTSQACTPEQLHKILRFDYIPKLKVKEKIEELKGRKMDIVTSQVHNTDEKLKILEKDKIREAILKELLEEGE